MAYAVQISTDLGVDIPKVCTFSALSGWLSKYAPEYKQWLREQELEHEAKLEAIDGRRDW